MQSHYVEQPATVVAVRGATVMLATTRTSTCLQCAMQVGCGQRLLQQISRCERSQIELGAPANVPLQVGQEVKIAIPQSIFMHASLWVFLVPLLSMLLGALTAQYWLSSDSAIAFFGMTGLAAGILLMRQHMRALQQHEQWQPHIIAAPSKLDH